MSDTVSVLEASDITVRFGGLLALDKVSIRVSRGTIMGIIGPNGAGKTTLFNVVAGIQTAVGGRVAIGGHDVTQLKPHRRARLGLSRTFQRLEVFGTLSVRENLLVAAEARRGWDRSIRPSAVVDELIERLNLGSVAGRDADSLPTGTQRLVELARALATGPRLLLLDEASSGLSGFETDAMAKTLVELAEGGLTVVLVEHDMPFVMALCHRVAMLDHGVVVAEGTPSQVQSKPEVQAAYLGSHEVAS